MYREQENSHIEWPHNVIIVFFNGLESLYFLLDLGTDFEHSILGWGVNRLTAF